MPVNEQRKIVSYLKAHPSWDDKTSTPNDIKLVETHGAFVLVGNSHALKIKKAVKFDYMDYSTTEKRHRFCLLELALNRRTAPDLYLDVIGIYPASAASYTFSPTEKAIEWAIKMCRFDVNSQFDTLAAEGRLGDEFLDKLTDEIAKFHLSLSAVENRDILDQFRRTIKNNFDQLDDFSPHILAKSEIDHFRTTLRQQLLTHSRILSGRNSQGYTRFGHGDLHLQNICLLAGKPTLYDGIEYSEDFAITDIFYDLSFLLMDIKAKMTPAAANRVLNRYLTGLGALIDPAEYETLAMLPWYLAIRAGIRAHSNASLSIEKASQPHVVDNYKISAKFYLDQALAYLRPEPARLIAVGGFSGSGKSTLSTSLAPCVGNIVGALHIRSDVIRRKLMNWDEYSPMPQSAYTVEMSQKVYQLMKDIAATSLKAGHPVILDAVFDRKVDRAEIAAIANQCDVAFDGIWLRVSKDNLTKRIESRVLDASDATVEVMHAQQDRFTDEIEWHSLEANMGPEEIWTQAVKFLNL